MKTKLILLIIASCSAILGGCYDYREIDETAYIVALGIDTADKGNFSYTFQFSSPLAISGDETSQESDDKKKDSENSTVSNLTIKAPDFYIAKNLTNNFLSKNIDMSHLKLIIFSSGISPQSLENHSQLLLREREIRPHTAIAIASESAADCLKNITPEPKSNTSKYYELMSLRSNNVYSPAKRLHDFVDESAATQGTTYLPIALSGKDTEKLPESPSTSGWVSVCNAQISSKNTVLCGMAIYKDNKLVTVTDGDSAMIMNILKKNIEDCSFTVKDKYNPQKTLSFRLIVPEKAHFSVDFKKEQISVIQELRIEYPGGILPQGYKSFDELYSYGDSILTQRIESFFADITQRNAVDIMNIKSCTRKDFLFLPHWNSFDWDSFYKRATITVKTNIS